MGDALMSDPVIYVAKIMAQSADAAANSIHENLQQVEGQQKSHAAKVNISSCQRNLMKTYHNEANPSGITIIASKNFLEFFEQSS